MASRVKLANCKGKWKMVRERHGWLRDALADKGLTAADLARAWGVDDAVTSRFIKTGQGDFSFERVQITMRLLGLTFEELSTRMGEKLRPLTSRAEDVVEAPPKHLNGTSDDVAAAMNALQGAAKRVRQLLPGYRVNVTIEHKVNMTKEG
jgi:hypothetical protein